MFAETLIPLVDSAIRIDVLELELAARYSENSIKGGDTTWKTGLNWTVIKEVRLRSTYSHALANNFPKSDAFLLNN